MTGSKSLSGVEYHTGGRALYSVTIDNAQRNTYVNGNAISFGSSSNLSITALAFTATAGNELQTTTITNRVGIISATRLINSSINGRCTVSRTLQGNTTSSARTISGILMDNASITATTATSEDFNGETFRLASNSTFDTTTVSPNWTSTNTIADAGSTGYNDGLQITNGILDYPAVDYSAITNGPAGNVDYSTGVTGTRYYYRVMQINSGSSANFRINFDGSGTFISEASALGTNNNNIKFSIKAPTETGWMDAYNDFSPGNHNDGDGCRDTSGGNAGRNFNNWDVTIGTKNTANSGGKVIIRITVGQGWTGNISNFTWSFN
jgi:hypothetical protein